MKCNNFKIVKVLDGVTYTGDELKELEKHGTT
jgi:hypothetical protein